MSDRKALAREIAKQKPARFVEVMRYALSPGMIRRAWNKGNMVTWSERKLEGDGIVFADGLRVGPADYDLNVIREDGDYIRPWGAQKQ